MLSLLKFFCCCLLFCFVTVLEASDKNQKQTHEIQILIDVSGSMKQNDPNNLRIPALKLLVNLLPQGAKVGIWLFAEKTKVLIKTGIVDKKWKKNALSKLGQIHSRGLFTNIEDAIQTAGKTWFDSGSQHKSHLILLTDGMVDVSKDIMLSAESRERVLTEQIPLLQKAGIKVQTIALSENADAELLQKLAFDTQGWAETAWTAEQLQKVFFKIFKQSIPQDTVPLKGNIFNIDNSIKEFSILLFKKSKRAKTELINPDGTKISSAKHKSNVAWLDEKSYDLITVKQPAAGVWRIDADFDPDNQVMIVTDLKFNMDELPNQIMEKETFDLSAYFTDKQQLISRDDFLSLIDISIEQQDEQGKKTEWKMHPVKSKAGLFSQSLGATFSKGRHTLKITADGKTFQREFVHYLDVINSPVSVVQDVDRLARTIRIKLMADKTILNTEKMNVQAVITYADQKSETRELAKKGDFWEMSIVFPSEGEQVLVNFSVLAKTIQGEPISPNIKPIVIDSSLFLISESKDDAEQEVAENNAEAVIEEITIAQAEPEEMAEEQAPKSWLESWGIVIAVNIFVIAAGFFLFKNMKNRATAKQQELLGRLK